MVRLSCVGGRMEGWSDLKWERWGSDLAAKEEVDTPLRHIFIREMSVQYPSDFTLVLNCEGGGGKTRQETKDGEEEGTTARCGSCHKYIWGHKFNAQMEPLGHVPLSAPTGGKIFLAAQSVQQKFLLEKNNNLNFLTEKLSISTHQAVCQWHP